jgi:cobalt-zinc-cadmium efflux system membrane fusion protein
MNIAGLFRFSLAVALLATACSPSNDAGSAATAETKAVTEHTDGLLLLTAAQVQQANLSFGTAEAAAYAATFTANAELVVHPEDMSSISAPFEGQLLRLNVRLNERVAKGQVVAFIRQPLLVDWQQEYLQTKDELVFLQADYERYKSLSAADATAAKNLQRAEATYKTALTRVQALAAKLKQYNLSPDKLSAASIVTEIALPAPAAGIVTNIAISPGAALKPGDLIAQLLNPEKLHADIWIYEKDLPAVSIGQEVALRLPAQPAQVIPARIYSLDAGMDPARKALRAHARPEGVVDMPAWVNGAFAQATIRSKPLQGSVAIPATALMREGEADYIFILEKETPAGMEFRKLKVMLQTEQEGKAIVLPEGELSKDAKIVIGGVYFVAARVEPEEE